MAQELPRKTLTVFGKSGGTSNFGKFGSQAAASPVETKDILTIQQLSAWVDGWQEAVALGQAPYLQDMNGWMYVHSYETGYVLTEGIPEWDSTTVYNWGSIVKLPYSGGNNFQIFVSLGDSNSGNALPSAPASNAHWQFVMGFVSSVFTMGTGIAFGNYATQGIIGTPTNNDAAAGFVGEYMENLVGATNVPTTNQFGDLATITLTAGDWDVTGFAWFSANGATWSSIQAGISTHTGNDGTGLNLGINFASGTWANSSTTPLQLPITTPGFRIKVSTSTPIYLKYLSLYSVGTPQAQGRISARRVR